MSSAGLGRSHTEVRSRAVAPARLAEGSVDAGEGEHLRIRQLLPQRARSTIGISKSISSYRSPLAQNFEFAMATAAVALFWTASDGEPPAGADHCLSPLWLLPETS